jgi:hypothetical protein
MRHATGYYLDSGGYAWHWDRAKARLTLIAAPGGGMRWSYTASHPKFAAIFAKIVNGKEPWTDNLPTILAIASAQGGTETGQGTGTATPSSTTTRPTLTLTATAPTPFLPPTPPRNLRATPIYKRTWFPFAVAGAGVLTLGLLFAALRPKGGG